MEDTSIFQGVVEFKMDDGEQIRAMKRHGSGDQGRGRYEIFCRRGDAYVREREVYISRAATPRAIAAAINAARDDEYEDELTAGR